MTWLAYPVASLAILDCTANDSAAPYRGAVSESALNARAIVQRTSKVARSA